MFDQDGVDSILIPFFFIKSKLITKIFWWYSGWGPMTFAWQTPIIYLSADNIRHRSRFSLIGGICRSGKFLIPLCCSDIKQLHLHGCLYLPLNIYEVGIEFWYWPLGDVVVILKVNLRTHVTIYVHRDFLCHGFPMNATRPHCWKSNIGSGNAFGAVRQQSITRANVIPDLCSHTCMPS